MKIDLKFTLLALSAAFCVAGCNVGMAPAGMSPEDARANFEKQSPEEQIKMINGSPASPQQKAERIAEIRRKHNLPDPGGQPVTTAPPQQGGGFPGDPRGGR